MTKQKLVITGMGAVTPIGIGVDNYWNHLINGVKGIAPITRFDTSDLPVHIAGEIKDFQATDHLPKKLVRETDPFMHYALIAANEALAQSKLSVKGERIGIVMSSALNGITTIAETQDECTKKGVYKVSPRFVPKVEGNIAAAQIAITHGIQGPSLTLSTACASGVDAIGTAAMLIRAGEAEAAIAVGADSTICPIMLSGLANSRALSLNSGEPSKASKPFDLNRDGFVVGEGGGALIIETEEHAKKRGAVIYAELLGYDSNTDGYHVTSPAPDGNGAISCMRRAIQKAGLTPEDIDYINAHGTATKVGDEIEVLAIKEVFGKEDRVMVSSTKGATGHMMAGGGITETIACIQAVRSDLIPPTLNYETPDPNCQLNLVANVAKQATVRAAMSNAFGFGGQNASVIVGKYCE
ncbi:MAG: beta-ketoacyl-ACP synthase II [Oscillospiraceae bacterium]|nr:beta-ketoacyl-ACP synthase II [Oscillospiraceae bacterium]